MIKNQLLRTLPLRELNSVFSHLKEVSLKKRDLLQKAGGRLAEVYFPDTSMVSYLSLLPGGRQRTAISIVGSEGLVGGESLLSGVAAFDAVVEIAGFAHGIGVNELQQELEHCVVLNDLILKYTNALLVQVAQTAVCNKFHSLQERVARWLLLAEDRSESHYGATRDSLAGIIGTNRTSIVWVIDMMEKEGLIVYSSGIVSIGDRSRLISMVCACYQTIATAYANLSNRASS